MSLPAKILIGAALGLLTGLFLGDACALLRPVGQTYVLFLEAPVYPYLLATLIHGLGTLRPAVAAQLLRRGWPFLLLLWGVAYLVLFALSRFIPAPVPHLIDADAAASGPDLLHLLVPANLALAVHDNHLPAVVVFAIVTGVALQGVPGKEKLLDVLGLVKAVSLKVWNWVVRFAPLGVFALVADTSGTIALAALQQAALYLVLLFAGVFLLSFWLFPALLTALTPLRYRDIVRDLKVPMGLSLATTLSVVALPGIVEAASKLAAEGGTTDDAESVVPTVVSVGYALAQVGNGFVYLFVLFAAFNFDHYPPQSRQVLLPLISLPASVGSPSASVNAVTFLATWLGLPADTTGLYVELMTLTRYGQVAVSVVAFYFLSVLVSLAYLGRLRPRWGRLALHLGLLAAVCVGLGIVARFTDPHFARDHAQRLLTFAVPERLTRGVEVTESPGQELPLEEREKGILDRIARTATLRVGYSEAAPPFCYRNDARQLVGYDMAAAYSLARFLGCRLEFVPLRWAHLVEDLEEGRYDIAMSDVYPSRQRALDLGLTRPYLTDRMALIVRSEERGRFFRFDEVRKRQGLRVGVFSNTVLQQLVATFLPEARPVLLAPEALADRAAEWDAVLATETFARTWVAFHPGYTAVVPNGLTMRLPISYAIRSGSPQFLAVVNDWVEIEKANGFFDRQYDYWVRGRPPFADRSRWCIARDVLRLR